MFQRHADCRVFFRDMQIMESRDEMTEAMRDLRAGEFGKSGELG